VPAPAAAGLAMLPLFLWFVTDEPLLRDPRLVAPWTVAIALLMVSSLATFSWSSLRLRPNIRFEAIAVVVAVGAAAVSAPWQTAAAAGIAYIAALPFSVASYARVRRLRAGGAASSPTPPLPPSA
jgi:CDP-diacylglycerol--serine O-phosphatidyltransferase